MECSITPKVQRTVTLSMTEQEAKLLTKFIGWMSPIDIEDIVTKHYREDLNPEQVKIEKLFLKDTIKKYDAMLDEVFMNIDDMFTEDENPGCYNQREREGGQSPKCEN